MDMSHFWQYETQIPSNVGFSLFGRVHFFWLISITICLSIFLYFFQKYEKKVQQQILHLLGWSLILLEIGRIVFLWKIHFLSVYELPLHLCGLAGILCFLHAYTKWDWLAQTIYVACLPGTIGALLFPDWTMYPILNVIHIQAFLFHGLVIFYAMAMLFCGFDPSIKKIYKRTFGFDYVDFIDRNNQRYYIYIIPKIKTFFKSFIAQNSACTFIHYDEWLWSVCSKLAKSVSHFNNFWTSFSDSTQHAPSGNSGGSP